MGNAVPGLWFDGKDVPACSAWDLHPRVGLACQGCFERQDRVFNLVMPRAGMKSWKSYSLLVDPRSLCPKPQRPVA